jgi:hypothetical protein
LIVILLVAFVVRLYGVITFPFEQDELYTINEATLLFDTPLLPGIQARPLFFFLTHPIVTNLPQIPEILRILPLIFGILGVWVTWILASKLLSNRAALFAALLAALSPWHMYASAFTRYYSLIYLLAALVYWLVPKAYDTDDPKTYFWAFVALLLGLWTHPSFVFPVAAAILVVMTFTREGKIRWQWPTKNGWLYLWGPFFGASAIVWGTIRAVHGSSAVDNGGDRGMLATLRLIPAMIDWMTPIVFVAGAIGALLLIASPLRERRRFGLMTLVGVIGMLIALFGLSFITSIYADYGIAALPLVFISVAAILQWAMDELPEARQRVMAYVFGALIIVGSLPSVLSYLSDGTRFDYRPAFKRIAAEGPDKAVFAWPIILFRAYAPELRGHELLPDRQRLDSLLSQEREAWAVVSVKRYGIVGDDRGDVAQWLSQHCHLVDHYQRPRLDYRMYRVDLWRCTSGS